MKVDAATAVFGIEAIYGIVIGQFTIRKYAARRRAVRFFARHPDVAEDQGIRPIDGHGPRVVVADALVWGEAIRIAIQGLFLVIAIGATFPKLFGVHLTSVIQNGFLLSSGLLDLQSHVALWMANRTDDTKGGKR